MEKENLNSALRARLVGSVVGWNMFPYQYSRKVQDWHAINDLRDWTQRNQIVLWYENLVDSKSIKKWMNGTIVTFFIRVPI